jgi:hydroxyacylglutathione hydrolase
MATNHGVRGSNPLRCDMFIKTFYCGPLDTNCYLVGSIKTREAIVIDAPQGCLDLLKHENNWNIKGIYITHSHWDHIADAKKLKNYFKVPLYIGKEDKENLNRPGADGVPQFITVEAAAEDHYLVEGMKFFVGEFEGVVIETPGHSPGGVCLFFPQEKVLFSGDTLFQGSMGRVDFPTSSPKKMQESLLKLSKLSSETKVYPGHGPTTTLAREKWIGGPQ